jgi:flagellar protein FliS
MFRPIARISSNSSVRGPCLAAALTLGLDLMLIDSLLEHIAAARACVPDDDCSEKGLLLAGAVQIVGELRSSLDLREGGPLAAHLDDLCDYVARQLQSADRQNRPELLDQVSDLLREVRCVWAFTSDGLWRHPCMTARIQ